MSWQNIGDGIQSALIVLLFVMFQRQVKFNKGNSEFRSSVDRWSAKFENKTEARLRKLERKRVRK